MWKGNILLNSVHYTSLNRKWIASPYTWFEKPRPCLKETCLIWVLSKAVCPWLCLSKCFGSEWWYGFVETPLICPQVLSAGLVQGGVLLGMGWIALEKTYTSMLQPWVHRGVWTREMAWGTDVRRGHSVQRVRLTQVWNNKIEAELWSFLGS